MFKSDEELRAEARVFEEENKAKVLLSIRNKLAGIKEEPKIERISYEEAKARGDVRMMIDIKFGRFVEEDRQREQEVLLNSNIVDVTNEYKGMGDKIADQKAVIEHEIEKAKGELKSDYEQRLKDFKGHRGGISEAILRSEYNQKLEGIEGIEHIKALKDGLSKQIDRRTMLENALNHYIKENKDIIAEEQRKKKVLEINRAGILDLLEE